MLIRPFLNDRCKVLVARLDAAEAAQYDVIKAATAEQHRWASRYNLRSRQKRFDVGEQVLILTPDSTTRMWSRWKAPAAVVEVKSPNSYIVEIDGRRQHVHSNKLCRYDVRVDEVICNTLVMSDMTIDSCSIVCDKDKDFGPISATAKRPCATIVLHFRCDAGRSDDESASS
jgi:hypothetical protein